MSVWIIGSLVLVVVCLVFPYLRSSPATWYLQTLWPGSRRRMPDENAIRSASH